MPKTFKNALYPIENTKETYRIEQFEIVLNQKGGFPMPYAKANYDDDVTKMFYNAFGHNHILFQMQRDYIVYRNKLLPLKINCKKSLTTTKNCSK
ncbi:MAG: hypothetical protein LBG21_04160 [Campylobacteraceae bacterium]|jgi:hypothetical protein|nr:hypothetical protein [Campylobacteraceae bacterium]